MDVPLVGVSEFLDEQQESGPQPPVYLNDDVGALELEDDIDDGW
jgi:hypothetical protein